MCKLFLLLKQTFPVMKKKVPTFRDDVFSEILLPQLAQSV